MTSFIDKKLSLLTVTLLCGCAQVGPTQYQAQVMTDSDQKLIESKPAYLQDEYKKLVVEGRRNQTLNYLRIGIDAFNNNDIEQARVAFDGALRDVQSIYANNPEAAKARSAFYNEDIKSYKGEPYERSMAYFYRGLIFVVDGELDSARAAFMNALMQDAFAEEQQNRSDFYVMLYMMGWSALMTGREDLANESFDEIRRAIPDFKSPSINDKYLTVVTTGAAPRKLADGVSKDQLVYRRGKTSPDGLVSIAGVQADFIGDVYWQASSRGGRPIDRVVEGQVRFKKGTRNVASALTNASGDLAAYAGGSGASGTLAGISLVGVGIQGLSNSVKVRADTRYWDNLPDRLHIIASSEPCSDQCAVLVDRSPVSINHQWSAEMASEGGFKFVNTGVLIK